MELELIEVKSLWKTVFQIARLTGEYPVLPQQEEAVFRMAKLARFGSPYEKRQLLEMIIDLRLERFKLFLEKNWINEAFEQLEKGILLATEKGNHEWFDRVIEPYFRNIAELKKILIVNKKSKEEVKMYSQEMYCQVQVGDRVAVRNLLFKGNGSKGEKICTGKIVNLTLTENRARIKLDEGGEVDICLSDIVVNLQGIYEVKQKKSFSTKAIEKRVDIIAFLILTIIGTIGLVCSVILFGLEGLQWIKKRFKKKRV